MADYERAAKRVILFLVIIGAIGSVFGYGWLQEATHTAVVAIKGYLLAHGLYDLHCILMAKRVKRACRDKERR